MAKTEKQDDETKAAAAYLRDMAERLERLRKLSDDKPEKAA